MVSGEVLGKKFIITKHEVEERSKFCERRDRMHKKGKGPYVVDSFKVDKEERR